MNRAELKELIRLYWLYDENKCKETATELKDWLNYCSRQINIKKHKSKQLKFK